MSTKSAESPGESLTDRLRRESREQHEQTEQNPFQVELGSGRLSIVSYIKYLSQLYFVHKALEQELRNQRHKDGALWSAIDDVQFAEHFLLQDLEYFSLSPEAVGKQPSTKRLLALIEDCAANRALELLGMHYVLLGSKHGGMMLAPTITKAYKLENQSGTTYLNPYGKEFAGHWKEFKEKLNALRLSDAECQEVVDGAKNMFAGVQEICSDLASGAK